ncbi:hypothetical protein [Clostridium sp.]
MKSKMLKKLKRKLNRGKVKGNILMEMAQDTMDIINNAKKYKAVKKLKK